jgi:hypothetical protein
MTGTQAMSIAIYILRAQAAGDETVQHQFSKEEKEQAAKTLQDRYSYHGGRRSGLPIQLDQLLDELHLA